MSDPIASITDFRAVAQQRLPRFLFDYIDGGSYDEVTLRRNLTDLAAVALRQRVLRDVSAIDMSRTLFGQRHALPLALGPIGLAGLTARRGEAQAARAAAAAGVPFCLSTVSACSIGEVQAASSTPFWFQLYMLRDRGFVRDMIARAADAGCPALVFTVDLPTPGARYRDIRSGLSGAANWWGALRRFSQVARRPRWAWDVGLHGRPITLGNVAPLLGHQSGLEDFLGWLAANFDPAAIWDDITWVRSLWTGPLIIKGVLDAEDARLAAEAGADGVIVSNHGGLSSMARYRLLRLCRAYEVRWETISPSLPMAAFVRASMYCVYWCWGPMGCCWGAPGFMRLQRPAKWASVAVSTSSLRSLRWRWLLPAVSGCRMYRAISLQGARPAGGRCCQNEAHDR
jgi:L-lactate dehydrogenase (cytochrome)